MRIVGKSLIYCSLGIFIVVALFIAAYLGVDFTITYVPKSVKDYDGWPAAFYDWQQGWSGIVASFVAATAAFLTIVETRRAARMQVSAVEAQIQFEKSQAHRAELNAHEMNLLAQKAMAESFKSSFAEYRRVSDPHLHDNAHVEDRLGIANRINLTQIDCSTAGVSMKGVQILGELITQAMRYNYLNNAHPTGPNWGQERIDILDRIVPLLDDLIKEHDGEINKINKLIKELDKA